MQKTIDATFYHFTYTSLIVGVPKLIKKIYESGQKLLVICNTTDEMKLLDKALWTFSQRDFIPHAMVDDDHLKPPSNPVLLALNANDNKNNAEVALNLSSSDLGGDFAKHIYAFYGNQDELGPILEKYQRYKSLDGVSSLTFWRQELNGKWAKQ